MSSLDSTRRALLAATVLAASATALPAVARNRKKKKKRKAKPTPPPLAHVLTMTTFLGSSTAGIVRFHWLGEGQVAMPEFTFAGLIQPAAIYDATATPDQAHALIVAAVQQVAAELLLTFGHEVPPERIAVTLV